MSIPRLIATREASALLGVTTRTVARWVDEGTLVPAAQAPGPRGAYLFYAEQVEALAAERTAEATR